MYASRRAVAAVVVAVGLLGLLAGCGKDVPKTYPVTGKFVFPGGDVRKLAGHHVEAALEADPAVRASGVIGADGSFTLETLHAGTILRGAREGKYQVRIVPADEDDDGRKLRKPPVASRAFQFGNSGLSIQVPAASDVTLEVPAR